LRLVSPHIVVIPLKEGIQILGHISWFPIREEDGRAKKRALETRIFLRCDVVNLSKKLDKILLFRILFCSADAGMPASEKIFEHLQKRYF
jgi:hypothetical protein